MHDANGRRGAGRLLLYTFLSDATSILLESGWILGLPCVIVVSIDFAKLKGGLAATLPIDGLTLCHVMRQFTKHPSSHHNLPWCAGRSALTEAA